MEALLEQMEIKVADSEAQLRACEMLADHLDHQGENLHLDHKSRILTAIIRAMSAHPQQTDLQIKLMASGLKLRLGESPTRDMFIRQGGVQAVMAAMDRNKDCTVLQRHGCHMIATTGEDILALPQKTTRAAAKSVLAAMDAHVHEPALVHMGIQIIMVLHTELNHSIAETSLRTIVKSIRAYAQEERIQMIGCMALMKLVDNSDGVVASMWAEGAVAAMVHGIDVVSRGDYALSPGPDGKCNTWFFEDCCDKLRRLYGSPHARAEPGITVLSRVIIKHMQHAVVVRKALMTLEIVARKCVPNRSILGRQAVRASLLALDAHKDKVGMQLHGLNALYALTFDDKNNAACLTEDDALRILMRNTDMYIEKGVLRMALCLVMCAMTEGGQQARDRMLDAGCVPVITRVMNCAAADGSNETSGFQSGFQALVMLIKASHDHLTAADSTAAWEAFQRRVAQEGAADALASALPRFKARGGTQYQVHVFDSLYKLFSECPQNVADFGLAALRATVEAMLSYVSPSTRKIPDDVCQVNVYASYTLSLIITQAHELAIRRDVQDAFGACGGFTALARYLQMCDAGGGLKVQRADVMSQSTGPQPALLALRFAVLGHRGNQELCARDATGIIHTVLRLAAAHPSDAYLQVCACGALDAMSREHEAATAQVVSGGGLQVAKRAMGLCGTGQDDGREFIVGLLDRLMQVCGSDHVGADRTAANVGRSGGTAGASGASKQSTHVSESRKHVASSKAGDVCVACGKCAADVGATRLLKCSACTIAPMYCSAKCQHACWVAHKAECKANRKK